MTSEAELKEIRSLLMKLNQKVDDLNELVEERLIGCEEPTEEDLEAIREYEYAKKTKKVVLAPLADLTPRHDHVATLMQNKYRNRTSANQETANGFVTG